MSESKTINLKINSLFAFLKEYCVGPENSIVLLKKIVDKIDQSIILGSSRDVSQYFQILKHGVHVSSHLFRIGDKIIMELPDASLNSNVEFNVKYTLYVEEYDDHTHQLVIKDTKIHAKEER